jgi:putative membrane protein
VIVLVVWGVAALVKDRPGTAGRGEQSESAMDILKKRYARGEISKEEFEERKKDLL